MLDIVAALKSLYDEPNSPNSDGKTPTELAEINGHSGVIGILSPGPSNNHTSSATFLTVRQKIEKSLSKKTCEMSTSEGDGDEPMLQKLMTNKKKKIIFKESILSFNERALKDPTAKMSIETESRENEPGPMDEDWLGFGHDKKMFDYTYQLLKDAYLQKEFFLYPFFVFLNFHLVKKIFSTKWQKIHDLR